MTTKELALTLGFASHSYISEIENGKKIPTIEMMIKISDVFGVTIDVLVRDEVELE